MIEAQLYEKIGRQHADIEARQHAYTTLLKLLAWVVSGEVDRSRVLVNLTDQTWTVSAPGTSPGSPATINGLPEVVIAPAPDAADKKPCEDAA